METRTEDEYAEVAELYDHVPYHRERGDVGFFVDVARTSGGPVVELGCGTGRVLVPTACAGVQIVGLDCSTPMLERCRARVAALPADVQARIRLVEDDMRTFDLGETFAMATLPFRSFQQLLTVDDQLACLAAIRRHLRPDGRLVLDLFDPRLDYLVDDAAFRAGQPQDEFRMPGGRRVVGTHRVRSRDLANQRFEAEIAYDVTHPDGREERLVHAFEMRYLFRFEGEHLLARSGFETEAVFADYEGTPHGEKYPRELVFVAHRRTE